MAGIVGIDPDFVIVHVLKPLAQIVQRLAAIVGNLQKHPHHVDAVDILGVGDDVRVILSLVVVFAAPLPGGAEIGGAEDAALLVDGFDAGVDHIGIRWRHREANAPQIFAGQAGFHLVPGGPCVGGFVNGALRTAVDQRPHMPAALIRGRQQDVGIARVHRHVGHAGVLANRQHGFPGLAAIGGLIQSAVAARPPQWPLRGDVDSVGIPWIDGDARDVLGLLQAHVLPRFAAVVGPVHAIAIGHAALAVVLARADPHHVGIPSVYDHRADGVGAFAIEHRRE